MKTRIIFLSNIACLFLLVAFTPFTIHSRAQELTLTTTPVNIISSKASIDLPGLTGNPLAIIVATPLGDTQLLNPHPIGAWYYSGKWNIFNTDHAVMVPGLKYEIQYFPTPGSNQFLHVITPQNLGDQGSYIDHAALNNNPNAQFKILQNHAPDNRAGYSLNRFEAKASYDTSSGKWYIANLNGRPLTKDCAYNIVISAGGPVGSNVTTPPSRTPVSTSTPVTNRIPSSPPPSMAQPTSTTPLTPAPLPTAKTQTVKTNQLTFDNLNDFAEKGLPASVALPSGDVDYVAAIMAQQILKSDDKSLPVLLTALQTAGFTVIDETGKVLLKPADGAGQGLAFYDFEAVGSLRLAQSGVSVSLEKIAGTITKDTPQFPASQLADLMLKDLREQANNSDNAYLRFWAQLIIELGKSSTQAVDLKTAPPSQANLSMLQATMLIRRLQGAIYTLKARLKPIGVFHPPFSLRDSFVASVWRKDDLPFLRPIYLAGPGIAPCNLTGDEALILDAAAVGLTTWNGWQVGQLGNSAALGKISTGIGIANIVLAWGKLVAAVTMMKGEIVVQKPLPLVRTKNSIPGDKRLMVARIWSEVGRKEMLNCVRPLLNVATGLDFNLPTDGPLADVAVEWHFAGENQIRVNDARTRNVQNFVKFESDKGTNANPQKQVTNNLGLSKMWLVGAPKIPAVVYQENPMKIEKKAEVLVGVTLKSSKDFIQNWIDIGGTVVGLVTGGPLGLIGSAAEIGYRLPYVAARATIPVIDHEPCDGQWQGTVTYTEIVTIKVRKIIEPYKSGLQESAGGYDSMDSSVTLSGTITVNGTESLADSSADLISISDHYTSGRVLCSRLEGPRAYSVKRTQTTYGSGNSQGPLRVSISLDQDNYQISLTPLNVKGTIQTNSHATSSGACAADKPTAASSTTPRAFTASGSIVGRSSYGADRSVLSGSDTRSRNHGSGLTVVTTITWNLRRCD